MVTGLEGPGVLLAGVRLTALFVAAPVTSHPAVPVRVRVGLAVAVGAALVGATASPPAPGALASVPGFGMAVVGEALVGATLGFATRLVFAGFGLLGELVSVQGGLGAATVLDPGSNSSSVALASLFQIFAVLTWLAIDGHHELVRAAALSFAELPLGAGGPTHLAFGAVAGLAASIFEIAVRIAAPITAAMLLGNLAVGILGRTIPQLNLMTLQLPGHVALTLLVIGLGANAFGHALAAELAGWTERALTATTGAP